MLRHLSIVIACILGLTAIAWADYTLAPEMNGRNWGTIVRGRSSTLNLELTSDANDYHLSAIFTVEFSQPGLTYSGYTWDSPYVTGGSDDWSAPGEANLPVTLALDTYQDVPGFDPNAVDVYFENSTPIIDGNDTIYTAGTIMNLTLAAPNDYALGDTIITAVPDTFDDGFGTIDANGDSLTLTCVLLADMDKSNSLNSDDINPFVLAMTDPNAYISTYGLDPNVVGDCDNSGKLDTDDIGAFVAIVVGGSTVPEPACLLLLALGGGALIARRRV